MRAPDAAPWWREKPAAVTFDSRVGGGGVAACRCQAGEATRQRRGITALTRGHGEEIRSRGSLESDTGVSWPSVADSTVLICPGGGRQMKYRPLPDGNWGTVHPRVEVCSGKGEPASEATKRTPLWNRTWEHAGEASAAAAAACAGTKHHCLRVRRVARDRGAAGGRPPWRSIARHVFSE